MNKQEAYELIDNLVKRVALNRDDTLKVMEAMQTLLKPDEELLKKAMAYDMEKAGQVKAEPAIAAVKK